MNSPFHQLTIFTRLITVDDSVILEQHLRCGMLACRERVSRDAVLPSDAVSSLCLACSAWVLFSYGIRNFRIRWNFAGRLWTDSAYGPSYHELKTRNPG